MIRLPRTACLLAAVLLVFPAAAQQAATAIQQSYQRGSAAMQRGDFASAEEAFRNVLKLAPKDVGAHANLGVIYMREKRWKPALTELKTAEALAPRVAGIRLNIGLAYYRQGDFHSAIPPFESVVHDQPDSAQARHLLGLCYFFVERYADAASTMESLWPSENGDLSYLYVLTIAAGNAGRHDLEDQATRRLLEVGKDSAEFHLFLGKAYLSRSEDDKALMELQRAAETNSKLPFVHYNLGIAYKRKHDFARAKAEFLKDMTIEPDVAYNYDELGTVCQALGQIQEAERYFLEAVRRNARLGTSFYGLAKIYKQRRKFPEALRALEAAGKIDPNSASVHYLKGQVLAQMGQRAQAEQEFAVVRKLEKATADKLEQEVSGGKYRDPQLAGEQK